MLVVMDMEQSAIFFEPNSAGPLATPGARWGVLLVHGFTGGPEAMRAWGQALATAGASVTIPLLSGHGTTVADLARTSAGSWRTDVQQALDGLLDGRFDHIAVGGLSLGGTLALDASAHRAIDATFVVNPGLQLSPLDSLGAFFAPLIHRVVPTVGPLAGDIQKTNVVEVAYDRTPVAAVGELGKLFSKVRKLLAQIASPVTLYWSPKDHILPKSSAKIVQRFVPGPLLRTVVLHDSYHVATLDHDAERIFQDSIDTMLALTGEDHAAT